jgi:hypothetical protein
MQACDTWNCINSFALWISALGTVSVSAIALWLTIRDGFLRMSSRFSLGIIASASPAHENIKVYILEFTNVGIRPITVTNYRWKIPFLKKAAFVVTFPQMDARVSAVCTKFPAELKDGQGGNIFHTEDFFSAMDEPENFLYPKNKIKAFVRIWFFKMYISTSTGKQILVKVDKNVRKKLWKEYLESFT